MAKNNKKIGLAIKGLAVLILLFFVYAGWVYYRFETGDLIMWGDEIYTREEVEEKWPDKYHVEAKNTPEEVYQKFRQALLDDDIETALECIEKEERSRYRELLKEPKTLESYKGIPEVSEIKVDKENSYENIMNYYYFDKKDEKEYSIGFIKKQNGYWKIEAI